MIFSIYIFIFWGLCPQTPSRALPLDPAGDFCPLSPVLSPPKQISGYAPGGAPSKSRTVFIY